MPAALTVAPKAPLRQSPAIAPRLAAAIRAVGRAASSPHTRRAYARQFARFRAWCRHHDASALPAAPAVVAAYLVELAAIEGCSVATVSQALAAIATRHRADRRAFDSTALELRLAMRGIRRKFAALPRQVKGLSPALIRDVIASVGPAPIDRRDAALLALVFAGALRRSELAGLDYAKPGAGDGVLVVGEVAIEITLLRSKARTEPATIRIPVEHNPRLVASLQRWIGIAAIAPGTPLFRAIGKGGHVSGRLSGAGVALAIKARIAKHLRSCGFPRAQAEAEAARYSGHSGRVGLCTAAAEAGVPIEVVAAHARHKSLETARRYARAADQLRRAPSRTSALAI